MAIPLGAPGKLTPVPARDQRMLLGAAVGTSALLLLAALAGHPELLAYAAPLFLLAVPLLAGRYVGEERSSGFAAAGLVRAAARGRRAVRPPARGRPRCFPAAAA